MQAGAAGEDSLRISLLTCGTGDEIYSLFGHTALRVEDRTTGRDVVYHYGVFDFDTPNFALKFALGETDYQMGMTSYKRFLSEYAWLGRSVEQQVLDLTPEEARRLADRLAENYRPENRVYRYSYFYDNCATRPRDQVEQAVEGARGLRTRHGEPCHGADFPQHHAPLRRGTPVVALRHGLLPGQQGRRAGEPARDDVCALQRARLLCHGPDCSPRRHRPPADTPRRDTGALPGHTHTAGRPGLHAPCGPPCCCLPPRQEPPSTD